MGGTVNISRRIWADTAFKSQPFTEREAFMWLIMEASYRPREKRVGNSVVKLERGQLAASVRFMADAWQWQKSTVDRFLKRLEKRDMIGTESGTGLNVITICKYNEYQNAPAGSGTGENENRDSSGTAAGQQRDKPNTVGIPEGSQREVREPLSLFSDVPTPASEISQAVSAYNAAAARQGWPQVKTMSPERNKATRARLRQAGGLDGWNAALERAELSDFICGRGERVWTAFGFDALVTPRNFTKLMEGNYDNRAGNPNRHSRPGSGTIDAFAAVAARRSGGEN